MLQFLHEITFFQKQPTAHDDALEVQSSESHTQTKLDHTDSRLHQYSHIYMVIAFGIWCSIVYALAQYELAGPFVLLTVFMCLVYFGTSSGRQRKKTELSAYSVFNPNCVRLKGTFTAEQFENELLRRPLDSNTAS